jgi:hydroxymethylbilane synthase
MPDTHPIVLGTRGSALARAQADTVARMLADAVPGIDITVRIITTEGDIDRTSPLSDFGGRGAFVRAIELALLDGDIDIAVHSLKDLPSRLPDGLCLGAAPVREDPRDVIVSADGSTVEGLRQGSVVATGSERRRVQLRRFRPDFVFSDIRGNIGTRLGKLERGSIDAVVLAAAGLRRLGLDGRITQYLDPDIVLPAPCQGALGVECRSGDSRIVSILAAIDNPDVRVCVDAERTFIATLGMGCHTPVACLAEPDGGMIAIRGFVHDAKTGRSCAHSVHATASSADNAARDLALRFRTFLDGDA